MMPAIEPTWAGKVEFYELLFGTWTVYIFLVLMWERALRVTLPEWKYALITFIGAGAFWVNHYFLRAPFWLILINLYTVLFIAVYWYLGVRGMAKSITWKIIATLTSIIFTVAFIMFEQLARIGVERWGMHEFCWMTLSYIGFVGLIVWRGRQSAKS